MAAPILQAGRFTQKCLAVSSSYCRIFLAKYAKKVAGGKMGAQTMKKPVLEVETDVSKLVQYCCGANIHTGGADPKLKPDEEYPEWLWTLRLERKGPDLSELDPDTYQYWRRLRKMTLRHNNKLMKVNKLKKK